MQMKIAKVLAALLILLASSTMGGAATTEKIATFTTDLKYQRGLRFPETSPAFRASRGTSYQFRLNPEIDIDGKLVVFELVMEGTNRSSRGSNLLDPTGRFHGFQKWDFGARDLAHGAARSMYGNPRTIDLPNLGLTVQVKVVQVAVKPTPATASCPADYRFTALTLKIVARAASVGARQHPIEEK